MRDGADWTVTQDRVPEAPTPAPSGGRGPGALLVSYTRRSWRGLTSMRTALVLLFLLAIAAVPGSLLPQESLNPSAVAAYVTRHPALGPWFDRAGLFHVYASPWFSAIYLLLFVSLVGCLLPRLRSHAAALRRLPPDAPARLDRMPVSAADIDADGPTDEVAARLHTVLRGRRYRTVARAHDGGVHTVSAEKGYLKETGNLLFHFSLLALLLGVAFGSWYGWHANRLLVEGDDKAFCSTLTQFDDYGLGARVSPGDIEPFCVTLDSFSASFLADGQPVAYTAHVHYTVGANGASTPYTLKVNDPLRLRGANVYLIGHGYAPVLTYTDRFGHAQTKVFAFLPQDGEMTSIGAAVFPDANVDTATGSNVDPKTFIRDQVGFEGLFLPTVSTVPGAALSAFPAAQDPMLVITPYEGDLGLDNGVPQSVYALDQAQIAAGRLTAVADAPLRLRPGQSATLPDGSSVRFDGYRQWVSLSIRDDPGKSFMLGGVICLIIGLMLSLSGRRRRVWFRVVPDPADSGRSLVHAGGLARAEYASFPAEFDEIVAGVRGKEEA